MGNTKCRLILRNTIFAMTPFDGKCQNLQTSIFVLANMRPVRTKATHRHTHIETKKPIAIGEILQICLKSAEIAYTAHGLKSI